MKLTSYIKKLQKIAKTYPNAKLVFASDSEGNDYQEVNFEPTLGNFTDRDFISEAAFEDFEEEGGSKLKVNVVVQKLIRIKNLYWYEDKTMYVYYTPSFWREI